jgi:hypothetical protein
MKDFDLKKYLAEGKILKEDISSHEEEAKSFLKQFIDDNKDEFEFIPDLETGRIDAEDNSYNVDELASIFLDIGQDIPRGKYNQKYKGEGGTYVVVAENNIKEGVDIDQMKIAIDEIASYLEDIEKEEEVMSNVLDRHNSDPFLNMGEVYAYLDGLLQKY